MHTSELAWHSDGPPDLSELITEGEVQWSTTSDMPSQTLRKVLEVRQPSRNTHVLAVRTQR